MEKAKATVFVVDDDAAALDSIAALMDDIDVNVATFPNGESFLEAFDDSQPSCIILDLKMPGLAGIDVLHELRNRDHEVEVIMISGHADVPSTVSVMRAGACNFMEKPFVPNVLREQVCEAIERSITRRACVSQSTEAKRRLASLTDAERRVLDMIVEGLGNKQIANSLEFSLRTFHTRRAGLLEKLQATNRAELIRQAILHDDKHDSPRENE